jgi:hypothetical protein
LHFLRIEDDMESCSAILSQALRYAWAEVQTDALWEETALWLLQIIF